ncbi:MAG: hypothetical protein ABI488_03775 [Polyangiaceae bacterium]
MMSAGFALRVDSNSHFLEFGVGVVLPANPGDEQRLAYGGVYGDIGANLYLAHASTSPYLGFGVMPGLASQEVTNLARYGQVGLMFFRESSTRIYADFRVAQNVLPVGFSGRSQYDSTTANYVSTPHSSCTRRSSLSTSAWAREARVPGWGDQTPGLGAARFRRLSKADSLGRAARALEQQAALAGRSPTHRR